MKIDRKKTKIGAILAYIAAGVVTIFSIVMISIYFINIEKFYGFFKDTIDAYVSLYGITDEAEINLIKQVFASVQLVSFAIGLCLSIAILITNTMVIRLVNNSCFEYMNKKSIVITNIVLVGVLALTSQWYTFIACLASFILFILDYNDAKKQVAYFTDLKNKEFEEARHQADQNFYAEHKVETENEQEVVEEAHPAMSEEEKLRILEEQAKVYEQLSILEKSYKNGKISFEDYQNKKEELMNKSFK